MILRNLSTGFFMAAGFECGSSVTCMGQPEELRLVLVSFEKEAANAL